MGALKNHRFSSWKGNGRVTAVEWVCTAPLALNYGIGAQMRWSAQNLISW